LVSSLVLDDHVLMPTISDDIDPRIPETEKTARELTIGYLLALSIIAGLSIVVHVLLESIVADQSSSATIVNVSGRQRMLSQRIAMLANEYALEETSSVREALVEAVELMERSHVALAYGDAGMGLPGALSPRARAILWSDPHFLDERVRAYTSDARSLASLEPREARHSAALQAIRAVSHRQLLDSLDAAVRQFELESIERVERLRFGQKAVLAVLVLTLLCEALLIFRPLVARVKRSARLLYLMATTDPLTRTANRRQLLVMAEKAFQYSRRHGKPLAAVMLDIDQFKAINDRYGHSGGDAAIRGFADIIRDSLRKADHMGRWGGDEFCVILPDAGRAHALVVGERIQQMANERPVTVDGASVRLATSAGVATLDPHDAAIGTLIDRADRALLSAKQSGRNRIAYLGTDDAATS
jgi:diguanylate cyclase (GGDEF)-like protein